MTTKQKFYIGCFILGTILGSIYGQDMYKSYKKASYEEEQEIKKKVLLLVLGVEKDWELVEWTYLQK